MLHLHLAPTPQPDNFLFFGLRYTVYCNVTYEFGRGCAAAFVKMEMASSSKRKTETNPCGQRDDIMNCFILIYKVRIFIFE